MGTIISRGLTFLAIILFLLSGSNPVNSQPISSETPLTIYGVGNNYAQGMDSGRRLQVFNLVKDMGAYWVKDAQSWRQMEEEYRVAKVEEAVSQAHSLGLKYFVVLVLDSPRYGAVYPTDPVLFSEYLREFQDFLRRFALRIPVDGISIGTEMSGPQWWVPDGVLDNKTLVGSTSAYRQLYKAAKEVVPANILVVSSSGDSDYGWLSGWASEMARAGFKPDAYAIYDYRFWTGVPYPYLWGPPENASVGDVKGNVEENIVYYQKLLGVPIVVTEAGYHHEGLRVDKLPISLRTHASLYARMAVFTAKAKPSGFFFHMATDDPDSKAGILNDDLSPRSTYELLSWLLPRMGSVRKISRQGDKWQAQADGGTIKWNTSTDYFEFTGNAGKLSWSVN